MKPFGRQSVVRISQIVLKGELASYFCDALLQELYLGSLPDLQGISSKGRGGDLFDSFFYNRRVADRSVCRTTPIWNLKGHEYWFKEYECDWTRKVET